jgi:hypothetical protein
LDRRARDIAESAPEPGDVVEVEVGAEVGAEGEGIGALRNPVVVDA